MAVDVGGLDVVLVRADGASTPATPADEDAEAYLRCEGGGVKTLFISDHVMLDAYCSTSRWNSA